MRTTERRAKYKARLQAEILEAARAIFVHEGYENFSMRTLAQRMGYSTTATYKHFKSKCEIFEHLADESFASLMAASESVKSIAGEDPVDRLKRGMLAYVHFGLQNPDHYRIAFLLHQPDTIQPPKRTAAYAGFEEPSAKLRRCRQISIGRHRPDGPVPLGCGARDHISADPKASISLGGSPQTHSAGDR